MNDNRTGRRKKFWRAAFIFETITLLLLLIYAAKILFFGVGSVWFDEQSPDGAYHVECRNLGRLVFYSGQKLEISFGAASETGEANINDVQFQTEIASDDANLQDEDYTIEWGEDAVTLILHGDGSNEDKIFILPYEQ